MFFLYAEYSEESHFWHDVLPNIYSRFSYV